MDSPEPALTPEVEPAPAGPPVLDRRAVITHGLVWSGLLQVFLVGINFASMIVLVRLLSPAEYGRVAAVTGVLAIINCLTCGNFISQAIQLHEGEEPDWAAHWNAGFYIQIALFIACNLVASACWLIATYRPMAPLLHVASIGFLLDVANQIGLIRLRRDLNYRTLRIVQALGTMVTVTVSISLAFAGAGAFALIIGYNVLNGLPQGLYLFSVQRWRPAIGWWRWPDWTCYMAPLKFGVQLSGSAGLAAARGMLEATVLPATIGYAAVGLLNRAQVLFSTTGGRVAALVVDTVYPLLPRSAGSPEQFSRHATLFVKTILFVSIPSAVFVAIDGPLLSRLLYGQKWIAADPLICPSTILAWAVATTLLFVAVLQARNRLRLAFASNLAAATFALPAMFIAIEGWGTQSYVWVLAVGQVLASCIAATFSSALLTRHWFVKNILPSLFAATTGALAVFGIRIVLLDHGTVARLCTDALAFTATAGLIHRFLFPTLLQEIVLRLPGRNLILRLLLLEGQER
jgi:O-antigen/teichoic acid export membrane protein